MEGKRVTGPLMLVGATVAGLLPAVWVLGFIGGLGFQAGSLQLFNWHPVLMGLGLPLTMGYGVSAFRAFGCAGHEQAKVVHMLCHLVGIAIATTGMLPVLKFHSDKGIPDFYSAHSWLGVIFMLLAVAQFLVGFVVYFLKWNIPLLSRDPGVSRAMLIPWHRAVGLGVYVLSIFVVVTGIFDKQAIINFQSPNNKYLPESVTANLIVVALLGYSVVAYLVMAPAMFADAKQTPPPINHGVDSD